MKQRDNGNKKRTRCKTQLGGQGYDICRFHSDRKQHAKISECCVFKEYPNRKVADIGNVLCILVVLGGISFAIAVRSLYLRHHVCVQRQFDCVVAPCAPFLETLFKKAHIVMRIDNCPIVRAKALSDFFPQRDFDSGNRLKKQNAQTTVESIILDDIFPRCSFGNSLGRSCFAFPRNAELILVCRHAVVVDRCQLLRNLGRQLIGR